jgi:hypothetical protein
MLVDEGDWEAGKDDIRMKGRTRIQNINSKEHTNNEWTI